MKKNLLTTAEKLTKPPLEATQEFTQKRDQLVGICNQLFEKRPDLERLIGKNNLQMAKDNNQNFAKFMESIFLEFQPMVLVETVLWVFRAYRSHGFMTTYWAANLNIWVDTLKQELSEENFKSLNPYYTWLIVNIPIFVQLTDDDIKDPPSPSNIKKYH